MFILFYTIFPGLVTTPYRRNHKDTCIHVDGVDVVRAFLPRRQQIRTEAII